MNAGEDNAVKTSGDELRFLLDGEVVRVRDAPPQTTLLEFLRERLGRTGTKEGCAEGDCGACTVMLGEPAGDGGLSWRPVNACIRLLPTIDGKALFTVESLKDESGSLHPVQQALVDCHGSQCGFCTPGFAMSLFGLYKNSPRCERAVIDDALSGNLCRCTGYRPIIAAAQRMYELPPASGWRAPGIDERGKPAVSVEERGIVAKLATLQRERALVYEFAGQRFFSPQSVEDLARLRLAHPDALLVAGATDVGLWVTKQHRDLGTVIHTCRVRELLETRTTPTHLEIGAAVSLTEAIALIDTEYPTLAEAWSRFASVPISNSGTLGGNIANGSPIGDSMPVLLALGARLVLRRGAERRELALDDFYLAYQRTALVPGEFVESIRVPRRKAAAEVRAYKISQPFRSGHLRGVRLLLPAPRVGCAERAGRLDPNRLRRRGRNSEACDAMRAGAHRPAVGRGFACGRHRGARIRVRADHRHAGERCLPPHGARQSPAALLSRDAGRRRDARARIRDDAMNERAATLTSAEPIGAELPHDSAHLHVAGEAAYIDDIPEPRGTLHAAVGKSTIAHGRIRALDLDAVRAVPGAIAVVTAADIPGVNDVGPVMRDEPILADALVQYVGQPIFAVAATSVNAARRAATLAKVEYETLPAILTIDEALAARSFVLPTEHLARGDAAAAIAAAPHRLTGRFRCGGQDHFYLEGQISLAVPGEDGAMRVHCSTQHPGEVQHPGRARARRCDATRSPSNAGAWAALSAARKRRRRCSPASRRSSRAAPAARSSCASTATTT